LFTRKEALPVRADISGRCSLAGECIRGSLDAAEPRNTYIWELIGPNLRAKFVAELNVDRGEVGRRRFIYGAGARGHAARTFLSQWRGGCRAGSGNETLMMTVETSIIPGGRSMKYGARLPGYPRVCLTASRQIFSCCAYLASILEHVEIRCCQMRQIYDFISFISVMSEM